MPSAPLPRAELHSLFTDRFIVDERVLLEWTDRLGARLLDPIKTTNVQQLRCMTTWCLKKGRERGPEESPAER